MNDFSIAIQIQWQISLLLKNLQSTTGQLSCYVQNFIAVPLLQFEWKQNEIMWIMVKSLSWNGPKGRSISGRLAYIQLSCYALDNKCFNNPLSLTKPIYGNLQTLSSV